MHPEFTAIFAVIGMGTVLWWVGRIWEARKEGHPTGRTFRCTACGSEIEERHNGRGGTFVKCSPQCGNESV